MASEELMLDHELVKKRKKTGKITALVALALTFVVAVLIVVAACIPVNLKPNISTPDRIAIYDQSSTYAEFEKGTDKYESFMQRFDDMYDASYLVSLFSGRLGNYTIEGQKENVLFSTIKSNELQEGYYIEFKYDEPQTLKNQDGTIHYSIYASNEVLTYSSVYFALSDTDGLETVNIYIPVKYRSKSDTYALHISQKANTFEIYNNIADYKAS